jgi:membrane-associated protease RseP (regulator of RpoE activity)
MRFALALLALVAAFPAHAQDVDLARLTAQDARLAAVAFKLASSNADSCSHTEIAAGWSLHDLAQYEPGERDGVRRLFSMTPRQPSILAVAPDGPAAAAGLQPGDLLMAVNGRRLDEPLASEASNAPLQRQAAALDAALAQGPVRLTVRRAGRTRTIELTGVSACATDPQIVLAGDLMALSEGRVLQVSLPLAEYAADDAELAFIVGHELAHGILDAHKGEEAERAADALALRLMARAGYPPRAAGAFWARLAHDYPQTRIDQGGHPSAQARGDALDALASEIEAARSP